jgi:hypothetical protein
MTVDRAAKSIGAILAPVVMLTACGILVSATALSATAAAP